MPRCHIALGGNLGDVEGAFRAALARLAAIPGVDVVQVSPITRTPPVGPDAGGEFRNAAAEIETALPPLALLDLLQELERLAGRTPAGHWTPRPLDLDIVFYADQVIEHERLRVPHPACWYRRFVLDPLTSIAPGMRHPVKGITVAELRDRLLRRPLELALAGTDPESRHRLGVQLAAASAEIEVTQWRADGPLDQDPAILAWLGPIDSSAAEPAIRFEDLPHVPRLDVSAVSDPAAFLQGVVQAALG